MRGLCEFWCLFRKIHRLATAPCSGYYLNQTSDRYMYIWPRKHNSMEKMFEMGTESGCVLLNEAAMRLVTSIHVERCLLRGLLYTPCPHESSALTLQFISIFTSASTYTQGGVGRARRRTASLAALSADPPPSQRQRQRGQCQYKRQRHYHQYQNTAQKQG